ncbi:ADP-L-glycero-D-manno-heptose 6-epimerase (plasmid) [Ensifer sp. WSM1721]|uniref:ADP-glyceromanno-heptose 6-epimerase n=1 Tax=Ensifer sp. WSM1721 TaxID=1041159 RepID=UPI00047E797C|nr:ADP-glyceromanno-heptose 6-epimerase [Ensifer sp. WSM1721]
MILVTGGAGFIGSNVVEALSETRVVAICDWFGSDDKWKNVRNASVEDFVLPSDLPDWLARRGDSLSGIIHMGAISATTERDVDRIIVNNLQLSRSLWDFAAAREIPFIYASSAATYGNGEQGFIDRSDWEYLATLRPLNPYGWSKLAFDRQVLGIASRDLPAPPKWAGLKFFNVYGPREGHKGGMRSVPYSNYDTLRRGEPLRLFKSERSDYEHGGQKRDFVYVGDCVQTIIWMLDNEFKSDLYNVGTGRAETWLDVARAMFAAMDREPQIEFIDMPESLRGRYQYMTEASMSKLAAVGCPIPATSLRDGVAATYRYLEAESADC